MSVPCSRHACMRSGYELRSSGRCTAYITSIDECNEAAAALSLKDTSASSMTSDTKPPGCYYFFSYSLKMNTASSMTACSSTAECLCKSTATLAPALTVGPSTTATLAPTRPATSPAAAPTTATGVPTTAGSCICMHRLLFGSTPPFFVKCMHACMLVCMQSCDVHQACIPSFVQGDR